MALRIKFLNPSTRLATEGELYAWNGLDEGKKTCAHILYPPRQDPYDPVERIKLPLTIADGALSASYSEHFKSGQELDLVPYDVSGPQPS